MTKPIYIHGSGSISIQPTHEPGYRFEAVKAYAQNPVPACDPDYKSLIPALQLRRMNKSMRMAIFASRLALQEAGKETVDAVITGTGLGCLSDSERFVETVLANEHELLNPTPFIQSTHNMAAAAIALSLGCKGYNMTYVNNASAFASALLDAGIYLAEHPDHTVLLGGVDELGARTPRFWELAGYLKHDNPVIPTPLAASSSPGEIAAEGASFFVASQQPTSQTLGKVIAGDTCYETADAVAFVNRFLRRYGLAAGDIDAVVLGYNGDIRYDAVYSTVGSTLFAALPHIGFKHIFGEYDTVAGAALHLALRLLGQQDIPQQLLLNGIRPRSLRRILIYTQRRGTNHGLILVEKEG
ncbi:3-oxoacyl-(acyl-carrier-protein) synthase [Parapedobacter luteus]|uniref:3-oxoacyl-(Acyl-carrier-protein) synthase n=1 Tax=Parapedobacter luteus TaxID=623280 RepID=A0A1T5DU17_9SPHI|nr:beta-ketoacyl synthase N-terminal-like domain-containing protein [Parapedobacter luteus]SKB75069.1 3-oxoacyl-(acyl-carrier-protein) synthase [Parapedobacter luteus]